MRSVAPLGPIYQAGTLSGNPLAVTAGIRDAAAPQGAPGDLRATGSAAPRGCGRRSAGITVNRVGSMFTFFFTDHPVTDWESAKHPIRPVSATSSIGCWSAEFIWRLRNSRPAFVSAAHSEQDVRATVGCFEGFSAS